MSRIIVGLMRLNQRGEEDAYNFLNHALEMGCTHFDHADIYGNGECERIFGRWINKFGIDRDKLTIQSKCGICLNTGNTHYNNSKDYILKSVDEILQRLGCEYLDTFLIHRPDILMDRDEIAEAFKELKNSGKVQQFGVSNFNTMQIKYLNGALKKTPIEYNQMQMSIAHAPMISEGLETNTYSNNGLNRSLGTLDYCRSKGISLQIWSPLQFGTFAGTFIDNPTYGNLNGVLAELSAKYQVSKAAIAIAWLLRIGKNVNIVSGTTNIQHLSDILNAEKIILSHEEWYKLYTAAGYSLP